MSAANKTLDPTTCTSAADAFHYPLPQVRQFHRTLTTSLDKKNARLRSLVGGSYRQLLGTAETILQMREDVEMAEEKLGRVGRGCGRTVVSGKAAGLAQFQIALKDGSNADQLSWLAKKKVLEMCAVVLGRLLRKGRMDEGGRDGRGKNLVMAAKVLVLSRLLAKSLGYSPAGKAVQDVKNVGESRKKLGGLRRKLLRAIEKTMEKADGTEDRDDLVQAVCAYSLATSSSAKDVLRHFLHVRAEAMALAFEDGMEGKRESLAVVKALRLYTRTLLDVQALVPRRLREALEDLKRRPLLKDESIREIEELRLDVSGSWFGDQINFFTPYNRHDDLDGPLAVDTLQGWAKKSSEMLLQGFERSLQLISEFKAVVELRTKILELWIKDGGKAKGFDPSVMLNSFREVINSRLLQLLESRVSKLHLVGTEIEATIQTWRRGNTGRHNILWDPELLEMQLDNGAQHFKDGVLARMHGRNEAVSKVFNGYQTWNHLISEVSIIIASLKKQRWDDDLEDMEDDFSIETRSNLLSSEDPQMLQDHLDTSLEKKYAALGDQIRSLLETQSDGEDFESISIYTIRILRDIRSELPQNASVQTFGLSLVPALHRTLAISVARRPVERFDEPLPKKVVGRALWEGTPELPVLPSPKVFRLLYNLTVSMAEVGSDLWSSAAVIALKKSMQATLKGTFSKALEGLAGDSTPPPLTTNGPTPVETSQSDPTDEDQSEPVTEEAVDSRWRQDVYIQLLFDVLVLHDALRMEHSEGEELQGIVGLLEAWVQLETSVQARLQHSAHEYWKKTSLLFGHLG
ncbi:hypothetical protein BJ878DRAFT_522573 [Calycina marina]|uniref:Conserved oligomeric Golgi complex subunit 1 n=1 Tax=Calycina marina TaxID=1763456 RepID=A0A9P7YWF8_9HELO|nr:hypothetical protein BJ878DRAFT_522573 [Calycina marina]